MSDPRGPLPNESDGDDSTKGARVYDRPRRPFAPLLTLLIIVAVIVLGFLLFR